MTNNFLKLGISSELNDKLKQNSIVKPTQIQVETIPAILNENDIIAQAQTGTGKTLAFLLPMMEKINSEKSNVQGLIVTPTRELAIQITAEAKKYMSTKGINILAAYGGQDVEKQLRKLKGDIHLVIATPGRLIDHLRRKSVDLGKLKMLVLDEADQMLNMGFLNDIEDILYKTPKSRQTMSFSATMPKAIRSLAGKYMNNPTQIQIQSKTITIDKIKQMVIETSDRNKQDALCKTIEEFRPFMAIIFCRTKRRVSKLNEELKNLGYNCDELHGDLSQGKREKVMKSFRDLKLQFLIATDVAARGLDIEGVTHIFNYDIAQDAESYIHRIGRTGRAGEAGVAVTFATARDRQTLDIIEKGIKMTIQKRKIENDSIVEKDIKTKSRDDNRSRDRDDRSKGKNKRYKERDVRSKGKNKRYKEKDNKSNDKDTKFNDRDATSDNKNKKSFKNKTSNGRYSDTKKSSDRKSTKKFSKGNKFKK